MNSVRKWFGLAGMLAVGATGPAMAQTAGGILLNNALIDSPNYYSTGLSGWSFEVTACTYKVAGVSVSCGGAEVIPTATTSTLSLVYENASGTGSPLVAGATAMPDDFNVTLNIKAPGVQTIITSTDSIAGTGTGVASVSVGFPSGSPAWTPSSTGISALGGPTLESATFATKLNTLSPTTDAGSIGGVGTNITTVTQTYTVPEPFSASLLGLGLAGIGFVRRKTRRQIAR